MLHLPDLIILDLIVSEHCLQTYMFLTR